MNWQLLVMIGWLHVMIGCFVILGVARIALCRIAQPVDRILLIQVALVFVFATSVLAAISPISLIRLKLIAIPVPIAAGVRNESQQATNVAYESINVEREAIDAEATHRDETNRTEANEELFTSPSSPLRLDDQGELNFRQFEEMIWSLACMLVIAVHGIAAVFFVVELVVGSVRLKRLRRQARAPDEKLLGAWQSVTAGRASRAQVCVSRYVNTPITFGWIRPVVVIPESIADGALWDLRACLAHEWAHIRRFDSLSWWLVWHCKFLAWHQPLFWKLVRELRVCQDIMADVDASRSVRDPLRYAELLVTLARRPSATFPARVFSIADRSSRLRRRVAMLAEAPAEIRATCTSRYAAVVVVSAITVAIAAIGIRLDYGYTAEPDSPSEKSAPVEGVTPVDPPMLKSPEAPTKQAQETNKSDVPTRNPADVLRVEVRDSENQPIGGAKIQASVWTDEPFKATQKYVSDKNGVAFVQLPKKMEIIRLWATKASYVPMFVNWEFQLTQGIDREAFPEVFVFRLEKGTSIQGFVKNRRGEPIQGAQVEVRLVRPSPAAFNGNPIPTIWLSENWTDTAVITDADGRWTAQNVPAGDDVEVHLRVEHHDYVSENEWGELQREQNVAMASLREGTGTIVLHDGVVLTGVVLDSEENPIADAAVIWGTHPYLQPGSQETRTNTRGQFRLPPLPARLTTVTVVAPNWAPLQTEIDLNVHRGPLKLQLQSGHPLKLRFVDQKENAIPSVRVTIESWRNGKALYNHKHPNVLDTRIPDESDDKGIYQWNWAPNDAITVRFYKKGVRGTFARDIQAGPNEQMIQLYVDR